MSRNTYLLGIDYLIDLVKGKYKTSIYLPTRQARSTFLVNYCATLTLKITTKSPKRCYRNN